MNNDIEVTSYYFTNGTRSKCYPLTVKVEDKQINFLKTGLQCLVKKGQEIIEIFNMTDGDSLYRLSFEPSNRTWKLLSLRSL